MTEPTNPYGLTLPHARAWRRRRAMTQGELAQAAGISRVTVNRAERGGAISMENVRKLASALGITVDQLQRAPK
jgi:transcriptional regulator with XRE-family HTH domain